MLIVSNQIYESYNRLNRILDKLEKERDIIKRREEKEAEGKTLKERAGLDINSLKPTISNAFLDIAAAVQEMNYFTAGNTGPVLALQFIIPTIRQRLRQNPGIEELCDIIKELTTPLDQWIEYKYYEHLSFYDYRSDFKDRWGGYSGRFKYSIQQDIMTAITNAIKWRPTGNTVFEVFGYNENLAKILKKDNDINVYVLDPNCNISYSRREAFKRVIRGDLKKCSIAKESFDVVISSPPINYEKKVTIRGQESYCKDYIMKAVEYIRPHGTIIFALPYFRFSNDLCTHVARNYYNMQYFTSLDDPSAVVVVAQKLNEQLPMENIDLEIYRKLRQISISNNDIPYISEGVKPIQLPVHSMPVARFRGSQLEEEEFVELHNSSRCTEDFWKEQNVEKLNESSTRPLLPFNIGQLGLILTSGCLDGVVDEGDGYCHVVKGRIVKKSEKTETIDNTTHKVQVIDTVSNRVEISAFLPNGTYKVLA